MATSPLMAVLLLGDLGFTPLQYGLAFGLPCVGGLFGARLARRLVERFGACAVIRVAGTVRACWSIGLAFVPSGPAGLFVVLAVQFAVVTSAGVFNPVFATYRLERLPDEVVVRSLSAWSVGNKLGIATMTVLGGALAAATDVRVAIGTAGVLLLATPLLLPSAARLQTPVSDRRGDRVG